MDITIFLLVTDQSNQRLRTRARTTRGPQVQRDKISRTVQMQAKLCILHSKGMSTTAEEGRQCSTIHHHRISTPTLAGSRCSTLFHSTDSTTTADQGRQCSTLHHQKVTSITVEQSECTMPQRTTETSMVGTACSRSNFNNPMLGGTRGAPPIHKISARVSPSSVIHQLLGKVVIFREHGVDLLS